MSDLTTILPSAQTPAIDPNTGRITTQWLYLFQRVLARTGGTSGISTAAVQDTANKGVADAAAAQTTANTGVANAATAQAAATAASAAVTAETSRAEAAEALLAPKTSPVFTGAAPKFPTFGNYANDAAAAAGGVAVGQFYRNGSVVMQRVV